ncbi:exotoxin, partial [Klebsiella pneumoniae]
MSEVGLMRVITIRRLVVFALCNILS